MLPTCDVGQETLSDDDKGQEFLNLAASPAPGDFDAGIDFEMKGVLHGDAFSSGSNVDLLGSANIVLPSRRG